MARVLGLDLGSYAVKAVLFETTMRGYQTKLVASVRRAQEGDRQETLRAAISELFAKHPMQADQVAIALPGPTLATHVVTLPFSDARRIEQTLPFEIEGQLPFDLDEVVFDYQLASVKEKKSDLLVGVVRKDDLRPLLTMLSELKVDPRIVTHPGITLQNILLQVPQLEDAAPDSAVAVIDIGHERTTIGIGTPGGSIEFARTFSGGGRDLTRALAAELHVPLSDAEQWKERNAAIASAVVTPEQERGAGAIVRGLQPVLREVRQSFKSFSARTRKNVTRVYLAGGTALLPGIDEQLRHDLGLPVERLQLPTEISAQVLPEEQAPIAQAYALALRAQATGAKAPRFNLRRGEFAFKGDFGFAKEKIGWLAVFGATLLLLVIASGIFRNVLLAQREEEVDAKMCEATQRVIGRCEKDGAMAVNILSGTAGPSAAVPKVSAVTLLAELTSRIPASANVQLEQVEVNLERITFRAETDNNKQIDAITTALKGYRCFKEVQQRKVEKSRDGTKVVFGLDIQIECPEEAAATPQG